MLFYLPHVGENCFHESSSYNILKEESKMNQNKTPNNREDKANKILTVIGAVLCVILIPILIVNCTLIVKSLVNKEDVPDFGGFLPLIVLTDSMYPEIKSGDLIFCKTVEAEEVNEGDVISFFDPAGNGSAVVTHKVERIEKENGKLSFITKGINNNTEDRLPVPADNLVGKYIDFRIPGAGNVALFMQSTAGLIVCVILPMVAFVAYDIIRRKMYEKTKGNDMQVLMAELESLKAQKAAEEKAKADEEKAALMAELEALRAEKAAKEAEKKDD